MPGTNGSASWQSSKYLPVTPSTRGDAASSTDVAAPCGMSFTETPVLPSGAKDCGGGEVSTWRVRPVLAIRPGLSALAVIRSPAHFLAASTTNSTFAVLDWL